MRRIAHCNLRRNNTLVGLGFLLAFLATFNLAAFAAPPSSGDGGILFSLKAPEAAAVFVAGNFNGWNAADLPLAKDNNGVWSVTVPLGEGDWEYKFVVDGNWLHDPDNSRQATDPFGGSNSLVSIGNDGSLAGGIAVAKGKDPSPEASVDNIKVGTPRKVDDGIAFTYQGNNVGRVYLAGSMNDWNAESLPLESDGKGHWIIVQPLTAGAYQYKFVVDGNWHMDPENASSQSDGFGGENSLVTIDAQGNVTASATPVQGLATSQPFGDLNAKITLDGRYMTRMEMAKLKDLDPRYRMLRPSQSVDLNFHTEVSDIAETFIRMRMDSNQNVILNNINSVMDEAQLRINPGKFMIQAYWNQETYTMNDIMKLGGDIDHPATIGHDHLDYGKGTAGMLFESKPMGFDFRGFFANVHNFDFYNDPDFYDNTGGDRIGMRFSRKVAGMEIGLPIWLERELLWLNYETLVGQPSTGIPALDEYLAETGDSSTWFETEAHNYQYGIDVRVPVKGDELLLAGQFISGDTLERFVTGNQAGENNVNGSIDVPFLERSEKAFRGQVEWRPGLETSLLVQHTYSDKSGANPDQRGMGLTFLPQAEANKQFEFFVTDSPVQATRNYSELFFDHQTPQKQFRLWLSRENLAQDYGASGAVVPNDTTRSTRDFETIYLSGLIGHGTPADKFGHLELEFGLKMVDPDAASQKMDSYEFITRYDRDLSGHLGVIADVRFIHYDVDNIDDITGDMVSRQEDYVAPFLGFRYTPLPTLKLVFGYGLDPMEFSTDYAGRNFGRWWYRQNYHFDNPEADLLDAEQYLADSRIFTLRAQLTF